MALRTQRLPELARILAVADYAAGEPESSRDRCRLNELQQEYITRGQTIETP